MCCFFTALVLFGPRLAILVWWLLNPVYIGAAFGNWIVPLLGFIFLPWTLLMYFIIYPGGCRTQYGQANCGISGHDGLCGRHVSGFV